MLIAGGDSFTWGSELNDCDERRYSRLSWSSLLAERLGLDYICVAKPGSGNHAICRRVIQECDRRHDRIDMVAVMWTYPFRFEINVRHDLQEQYAKLCNGLDMQGEMDEGWMTISVSKSATVEERVGQIKNYDSWFIEKVRGDVDFSKNSGIADLSDKYLNIASRSHSDYESISSIFCLESYLQRRKIPYLFAAAQADICGLIKSKSPLSDLLDKSCWLNQSEGFVEWVQRKGYPLKPGKHPVEEAHAAWIEEVYR
jgi:hypothetical protein